MPILSAEIRAVNHFFGNLFLAAKTGKTNQPKPKSAKLAGSGTPSNPGKSMPTQVTDDVAKVIGNQDPNISAHLAPLRDNDVSQIR